MESKKMEEYRDSLRIKAKAVLNKLPDNSENIDNADITKLIEELQLHQIELELQNEELRSAQKIIEENKSRYISLFNNAPVGYVILDEIGMIKQHNETFLKILNRRDIKKSGQAFADLLVDDDASGFRARYKALYKQPQGKKIEAKISTGNGTICHVLLEGTRHNQSTIMKEDTLSELMLTITDINDLKMTKHRLSETLEESRKKEKEVKSLLMGARAVLEQGSFESISRKVFDICSGLIGSTSGYVALLAEDGSENEVLFLEAGGLPCDVDPELPMPIRGLREVAYRENRSVYDNNFMESRWVEYMPVGHVRLENVMFAPLVLKEKTVGIIGLANKPSDFNDNDARIAEGFGELAAIALQNSKNLDKRDKSEKANAELIKKLQEAMANVKQLSGLIPICSHCKKIRDDKGYWNQIEAYISEHSDAQFSHGICMECAELLYPDFDLYSTDDQ
ncbi:putative PAS/PAC sensor protein [Desulfamplus magnetovallimortis]|uniref:Putative PAS/PAC sensor protein n=1 Tax=Desulfamplus magnetovallimortis TaxID=1246637 RepID=A0A1W1H6S7_9BACT|nr:GAF domain-containing protein [Desulfamplus magnetovallimortis]SLM28173.1 putative PAS/PAC sensor protein [Desulfamplus magnetovallimortis]